MNGHGSKLVWIQEDACIKNDIFLTVEPSRVSRIEPIDRRQRACQDRPMGANDPVVFTRSQSIRDYPAVGHHNADCAEHHPEIQPGRTCAACRQTYPWSTHQGDEVLCHTAQGCRAEVTMRFGVSFQFMNAGSSSRIPQPREGDRAGSMVSIGIYDPQCHRTPPPETCDGASAKCEGLHQEEGFSTVIRNNAMAEDATFDLLYLDDSEVHLYPTLTEVWAICRTRPIARLAGAGQKCAYMWYSIVKSPSPDNRSAEGSVIVGQLCDVANTLVKRGSR
jgi:hypothetical protein